MKKENIIKLSVLISMVLMLLVILGQFTLTYINIPNAIAQIKQGDKYIADWLQQTNLLLNINFWLAVIVFIINIILLPMSIKGYKKSK